MGLNVEKTGAACGALVTGVDLTQDLSDDLIGEIRAHWLENKVRQSACGIAADIQSHEDMQMHAR